jgi:hypothetical protein
MPRKQTTRKTTNTTAERKRTTARTGLKKMTLKIPGDYSEEVRKRAYELFAHRGYGHGNDLDDWFQAEREIKEKLSLVK